MTVFDFVDRGGSLLHNWSDRWGVVSEAEGLRLLVQLISGYTVSFRKIVPGIPCSTVASDDHHGRARPSGPPTDQPPRYRVTRLPNHPRDRGATRGPLRISWCCMCRNPSAYSLLTHSLKEKLEIMPPEAQRMNVFGLATDAWSFGRTAIWMCVHSAVKLPHY